MATKNSRFTDLGSGLAAEMVSDNVQIVYDPTTQRCLVLFTGHNYIKPGRTYLKVGDGQDLLDVALDNFMTTTPVPASLGLLDPVTGTNLSSISVLGMVYYVKFLYDMFHNMRAAAEAASDTPIDPVLRPDGDGPSMDTIVLGAV